MAKQIKLSARPKEVEVLLDEKPFKLVELVGSERDAYLNLQKTKIKFDDKGQPTGITDHSGMFSDLLCFTLVGQDGKKASREFVQSLPTTTQQVLFEESVELSGLGKEEKERQAAKND